ncbi:hypothetical protein CDAR_453421, partial [Caerostris darwini]
MKGELQRSERSFMTDYISFTVERKEGSINYAVFRALTPSVTALFSLQE